MNDFLNKIHEAVQDLSKEPLGSKEFDEKVRHSLDEATRKTIEILGADKIEKALANARASLAIEGMEPTEEETKLVRKCLKGELQVEDLINYQEEKNNTWGI